MKDSFYVFMPYGRWNFMEGDFFLLLRGSGTKRELIFLVQISLDPFFYYKDVCLIFFIPNYFFINDFFSVVS